MKKNLVRVLISSPGDVLAERKIAKDVIEHVNKLRPAGSDSFLQSLTWEDDVVPHFGKPPQEIINEAFEGNFEIFVGIMCARFGTPTEKFESGTFEEFDIAYKKKMGNTDSAEVMFYFKDILSSESEPDLEQAVLVQRFKKAIQQDDTYQGMYSSFGSAEEFRTALTTHLVKVLEIIDKRQLESSIEGGDKTESNLEQAVKPNSEKNNLAIANPLEILFDLDEDHAEEGFLDASENLELAADDLSHCSDVLTQIIQKFSTSIETRTAKATEISESSAPSKASISKLVNQTGTDLEKFVNSSVNILPELQDSLERFIQYSRDLVVILSEDFAEEHEELPIKSSIRELRETLQFTGSSIDALRASVDAFPRMTANVNRQKRRMTAILEGISDMFNSGNDQLGIILEILD